MQAGRLIPLFSAGSWFNHAFGVAGTSTLGSIPNYWVQGLPWGLIPFIILGGTASALLK